MRELHLLVGGMGCRHCVREVTARLRDVPGVERVVADATRNHVLLSGSMTGSDVMGALSRTTFVARIVADTPMSSRDAHRRAENVVQPERPGDAFLYRCIGHEDEVVLVSTGS